MRKNRRTRVVDCCRFLLTCKRWSRPNSFFGCPIFRRTVERELWYCKSMPSAVVKCRGNFIVSSVRDPFGLRVDLLSIASSLGQVGWVWSQCWMRTPRVVAFLQQIAPAVSLKNGRFEHPRTVRLPSCGQHFWCSFHCHACCGPDISRVVILRFVETLFQHMSSIHQRHHHIRNHDQGCHGAVDPSWVVTVMTNYHSPPLSFDAIFSFCYFWLSFVPFALRYFLGVYQCINQSFALRIDWSSV